jgi:hypothetical protein
MALNTSAKTRDEGNWRLEGWSPLIASESEFDTFVSDMLDRANNYLRYRVGSTWYTANSATDPIDDILKEAEMHLAQAYILVAAAGIAETGSDTNAAPFLGTSDDILKVATFRRGVAEEIILSTRAYGSSAKPVDYEANPRRR